MVFWTAAWSLGRGGWLREVVATGSLTSLHCSNIPSLYFQECDLFNRVTCVDLGIFNEASNENGQEKSVCLQCPDGTAGDGKECRGKAR